MKKYFYHVTSPENLGKILKEGLKANEYGEIFIFDEPNCAVAVAVNQLFLSDYALLKIDSEGIKTELTKDNVAELTAKYQYIIKQPVISRKYIRLVDCYKVDLERYSETWRNFITNSAEA